VAVFPIHKRGSVAVHSSLFSILEAGKRATGGYSESASDAMSAVNDRPRQLQIRTERGTDDDQVRLTIQDAGVGFDPQAMGRLFQASYTTKNDGMWESDFPSVVL
jgi:hypothetical protein